MKAFTSARILGIYFQLLQLQEITAPVLVQKSLLWGFVFYENK
jgi:hypothetical protein